MTSDPYVETEDLDEEPSYGDITDTIDGEPDNFVDEQTGRIRSGRCGAWGARRMTTVGDDVTLFRTFHNKICRLLFFSIGCLIFLSFISVFFLFS